MPFIGADTRGATQPSRLRDNHPCYSANRATLHPGLELVIDVIEELIRGAVIVILVD